MSVNRRVVLGTAVLLFVMESLAVAGPLATDPTVYFDGVDTWHGSTPYLNPSTGLAGYIDWAVYGPNHFPAGFLGYTPTADEFVYAYQGFETGEAPLSSISVVLENPADNIGTFTGGGVVGDAAISMSLISMDSATWSFAGVLQGGSTRGLAFSSPYKPQMILATTIDDGSTALAIPIPSPSALIPEPASAMLAACGLVSLFVCRLMQQGRQRSTRKGEFERRERPA